MIVQEGNTEKRPARISGDDGGYRLAWKVLPSNLRELHILTVPLTDYFEGLAALLLATIGDLIAGVTLGVGSSILSRVKGALMLVPAATGLRGNIFASMGSRLGTLLHTGELKAEFTLNSKLVEELYATSIQTIILGVLVGLVTGIASLLVIGPTNVLVIISISVLSSVLSYLLMSFSAISIAILTYRRGWDPDNFSAPVLTLFGDMVTIPLILASTVILLEYDISPLYTILAIVFLYIATLTLLVYKFKSGHERLKKIIVESMPVLVLSSIFSLLSGLILEFSFTYYIESIGLLIVVPAFLEDGGAIAGMLAARISTKLHLGELSPKLRLETKVLGEYVRNIVLGGISFTLVGVFGSIMGQLLSVKTPPLLVTATITFIAGEILVAISNLVAYLVSVVSFSRGLDPDNVTIPILTSIVDFSGVILLVLITTIVLGF